jgi:hypothetical protein
MAHLSLDATTPLIRWDIERGSCADEDAIRRWRAHLEAGRIGEAPLPAAAYLRCASLAAILAATPAAERDLAPREPRP